MTEEEFWNILHSAPGPEPVFYRLYYNDDGTPIIYSMEDLPGNYIEVDQPTYALSPFNVRVIDSKLTYIKPVITVKKLQPGLVGTACDPSDVCIVVDVDQAHTKWSLKTNEID